jgi:hypothetical protein
MQLCFAIVNQKFAICKKFGNQYSKNLENGFFIQLDEELAFRKCFNKIRTTQYRL